MPQVRDIERKGIARVVVANEEKQKGEVSGAILPHMHLEALLTLGKRQQEGKGNCFSNPPPDSVNQ